MTQSTNEKAEAIIASAKAYCERSTRKMTYIDYEAFKKDLINNGCYGYEKQLADALKI